MLHAKFHEKIGLQVLEKKIFEGFLTYEPLRIEINLMTKKIIFQFIARRDNVNLYEYIAPYRFSIS